MFLVCDVRRVNNITHDHYRLLLMAAVKRPKFHRSSTGEPLISKLELKWPSIDVNVNYGIHTLALRNLSFYPQLPFFTSVCGHY